MKYYTAISILLFLVFFGAGSVFAGGADERESEIREHEAEIERERAEKLKAYINRDRTQEILKSKELLERERRKSYIRNIKERTQHLVRNAAFKSKKYKYKKNRDARNELFDKYDNASLEELMIIEQHLANGDTKEALKEIEGLGLKKKKTKPQGVKRISDAGKTNSEKKLEALAKAIIYEWSPLRIIYGEPSDILPAGKTKKSLKLAKNTFKKPKKVVNSNLPHSIDRATERGIFPNAESASKGLKELSTKIKKEGFPKGTLPDTVKKDRVLVPVGKNGLAVYQVAKNGTAKLKTVLIAN